MQTISYDYVVKDGEMLEFFAASYFQTLEYFVESNLKWIEDKVDDSGKADVLELDILAKIFKHDEIEITLTECKRGCTFNDLFKFAGITQLVSSDINILLCQSHDLAELISIGSRMNLQVLTPEELLKNINNDEIIIKFELFMKVNELCNEILSKEKIRGILRGKGKLQPNEIKAYNKIRAYLSILIGKVWREYDCVKRVNWINSLLSEYKDFVREIARMIEIKPGNKSSEYYMNKNVLCQAAGYLVLKIKISYIICAVECAIKLSDNELCKVNDEVLKKVIKKLKENIDLAIKIPKFIQYFIYIFGGVYSEIDGDIENISNYIQESEGDVKKIITMLKELFSMELIGIQWGFTEDMGVFSLKYIPTPIKGIGMENRELFKFSIDSFCFADQWKKSIEIWRR